MGKMRQLSPELWPLIDVTLFSYIELIFRGGVSCLPAARLCCYGNIGCERVLFHYVNVSILIELSQKASVFTLKVIYKGIFK